MLEDVPSRSPTTHSRIPQATAASPDPLGMSEPDMRRLGHEIVDRVVDHWATMREAPVVRTRAKHELLAELGGPPPNTPGDVDTLLDSLATHALANMQQGGHPRYFARVPAPASFAAVMGDWLAIGFNAIASSWAGGSGPTAVELVVVDWIRDLLGMPQGTDGVLLSGGSMASLTALTAARAAGHRGQVYLSDQTHSSIARGLRSGGWPPSSIRVVPTSASYRWDAATVARAMDQDVADQPAIVVATAGTTNTGAVDPLRELADVCADRGAWLHVDAAYGGFAAVTDHGRAELTGLERADSVAVDPHKWFFQPYDVGCVLVRRPGLLELAFEMNPEYLRDVTASTDEVDLRNRSLELSRRSRALKIWLAVRTYGMDQVTAAVERGLAMARYAQHLIEKDPRWRLCTPAQLGVVTFSGVGMDDEQHVRRAEAITSSGFAAVSPTELAGRTVFRLCLINPLTTEQDVRETLDHLALRADTCDGSRGRVLQESVEDAVN
jgi:glutamate/tyrosine decarboxylase-like PLP-dependent enzyme